MSSVTINYGCNRFGDLIITDKTMGDLRKWSYENPEATAETILDFLEKLLDKNKGRY